MGFMLGSFAGGLMSGAQAGLQMYGMVQGLQQTQSQIDAANATNAAMTQNTNSGAQDASNANVPGYQSGQGDPSRASVKPQDMSSTRTDYDGPPVPDTPATPSTIAAPGTPSTPGAPGAPGAPSMSGSSDTSGKGTGKPVDTSSLRIKAAAAGAKLVSSAGKGIGGSGGKSSESPALAPSGSTPQTNATGATNPLASRPITAAAMDPDAANSPPIVNAGGAPLRPQAATPQADPVQNQRMKSLSPLLGGASQAPTAPAPSPIGHPSPLQPAPTLAAQPAGATPGQPAPGQPAPAQTPPTVADAQLSQDARAAAYTPQPAPSIDQNQSQLAQLRTMPPAQLNAVAQNPQQYGMDPTLVSQAQQERLTPPAPPAQPQAAAPQQPPVQVDQNSPQLQQLQAMSQPDFDRVAANPQQYGMDPTVVDQARRARPPVQPAPLSGGPITQAQPPSWSGRLLSAINPVSSAEAAPAPTLPPAKQDEGAATVGGPPIGKDTTKAAPSTRPEEVASARPIQPGPVTVTGSGGKVAPGQTTPSLQSETTPAVATPQIWDSPYHLLAEQRPDLSAKVDAVTQKYRILPQELAAHWYTESDFREQVPDDPTGANKAQGALQIEPGTHQTLDPKGTRNPHNLDDNLDLAAQRIQLANSHYGQGTPASWVAYMRGEGAVQREWSVDLDKALRDNPIVAKSLATAFPGVKLAQAMFPQGGPVNAQAVVQAGTQGGPDAFLKTMVATGPQGMPMTDLWRNAEGALVKAALMRGDLQGAMHAQDFVLQMSHAGMTSNLMAADQALLSGNSTTAAQYLAKAHAFFPDGTYGRFGTGSDGKLYAEQFNEGNGQPTGQRFEVTHNALSYQLMLTRDPVKFAQLVQEQQKTNSSIMLNQGRAEYYADLPNQRRESAQLQFQAREDATNQRAQSATEHQATILEAQRMRDEQHHGNVQADNRSIDTGASKAYGPDSQDTIFLDQGGKALPPTQRQSVAEQAASIYGDVRRTSRDAGAPVGDLQAQGLTRALMSHQGKVTTKNGVNAVVDPQTGQPLGYISDGLANRLGLAGAKPQQQSMNMPRPSPIGAGANSPMAAMAGMGTNLTGQPLQQQAG